MSKEDRQGARTPADLERRYSLGSLRGSINAVAGTADDAGAIAQLANLSIDDFKKKVENILLGLGETISALSDSTQLLSTRIGENFSFSPGEVSIKPSRVKASGGQYAYQSAVFSDSSGYVALIRIAISGKVMAPIVFTVTKEGAISPTVLQIRFGYSEESGEAYCSSFFYEGEDYGGYIAKTGEGEWTVFFENSSGASFCVQDWYTSRVSMLLLGVSFTSDFVQALPEGCSRALYVVSTDTVNLFLPIGIRISFGDETDPNEIYDGTEWECIDEGEDSSVWQRIS
jgi:hypothetical protein